ncbi:hypothetical protein [Mesorhizobium sp. M1322]|uniref:hypothetical protein n=1 Tax=Mesorhizobium sp. M1322 TaxID=2957081 RepID=UPI0033395297
MGMLESGSILLDTHAQSLFHQHAEAKQRVGAERACGILPPVTVVQDNSAIFMPE